MSDSRRDIEEITNEEIKKVNGILKNEYNYYEPLKSGRNIEYQCFKKTSAVYSGYAIIKVYKYLKSVGIDVLGNDEEEND